MHGDIVLANGNIHTLDPKNPRVSAVAIRCGRIICAGAEAEARALGAGEVVDLKGACVIPGLVDAHLHFEDFALGLGRVSADAPSPEEVAARVAEKARSAPPGSWLLGQGWNHNAWGGAIPRAALLDAAAPGNPVCLQDKSCHALWLNSAALALCGIGCGTADPPDGRIVREGDVGRPTGVLLEGATRLAFERIPAPALEEVAAAMEKAIAAAHRAGLTGVHDFDGQRSLAALQLLRSRGRLGLRVVKSIPVELLEEALALGLRTGLGDEILMIGHVKMFSDGAMGPQTAWMLADYEGRPGDRGICVTPSDAIRSAILRANAAGLSCAVHAIGDRANREVLDAFGYVAGAIGGGEVAALAAPNRIEHAQLLAPKDRPRLAALGIVASMQPIHATAETDLTDRYWGERGEGAYSFGTLLRHGTVLAFGSDCPVETMDPIAGIHAAVTRRRADGYPGPEGWRPDERLSVRDAVAAYTIGPARAAGRTGLLGSIEAGKLADFTILDRDILDMPAMEILGTAVVGTIVGGEFAWQS